MKESLCKSVFRFKQEQKFGRVGACLRNTALRSTGQKDGTTRNSTQHCELMFNKRESSAKLQKLSSPTHFSHFTMPPQSLHRSEERIIACDVVPLTVLCIASSCASFFCPVPSSAVFMKCSIFRSSVPT